MSKAGRPTKYNIDYNIQAEKLCLLGAMKIDYPCVYIITDKFNNIVYVGQTINPKKRFENYKYKTCHNKLLNDWLIDNEPFFIILKIEKNRLNEVEKYFIKKYKNKVFNKIAGGDYPWIKDTYKPWSAGHIKSPSQLILHGLLNNKCKSELIPLIKNTIKKMDNKQRCCFEIDIAKEYYNKYKKNIDKWLNITNNKIIECLEAS